MMAPVKVVLAEPDMLWADTNTPPTEVELGPFNQGIIIDRDPVWSGPCLIDVASGRTLVLLDETGHCIVGENDRGESRLIVTGSLPRADRYAKVFIQTYPDGIETRPAIAAQWALLSYMEHQSEARWCAGWLNDLGGALAGDETYEWLVEQAGGTWSAGDEHSGRAENVNGRMLVWVPS